MNENPTQTRPTADAVNPQSVCNAPDCAWFVLRDLKRANAKLTGYRLLKDEGFEVFTPLHTVIRSVRGRKSREEVPVISDLLFVYSSKEILSERLASIPTLQFRFQKGAGYCCPMTVRDSDMRRFIHAVTSVENPKFYHPGEITPAMIGRTIRIVGGPLNGYEGSLISVRGSKKKRLLVQLPSLLSVGVEVQPEFIQLI